MQSFGFIYRSIQMQHSIILIYLRRLEINVNANRSNRYRLFSLVSLMHFKLANLDAKKSIEIDRLAANLLIVVSTRYYLIQTTLELLGKCWFNPKNESKRFRILNIIWFFFLFLFQSNLLWPIWWMLLIGKQFTKIKI